MQNKAAKKWFRWLHFMAANLTPGAFRPSGNAITEHSGVCHGRASGTEEDAKDSCFPV